MAKGSAPRPSASRGTCLERHKRHAVCDWGLGATAASENRTYLPQQHMPAVQPGTSIITAVSLTQWYLTKFLKLTAADCRTSTGTDSSVISWAGSGREGGQQRIGYTAEHIQMPEHCHSDQHHQLGCTGAAAGQARPQGGWQPPPLPRGAAAPLAHAGRRRAAGWPASGTRWPP